MKYGGPFLHVISYLTSHHPQRHYVHWVIFFISFCDVTEIYRILVMIILRKLIPMSSLIIRTMDVHEIFGRSAVQE